MVDRLVSDIRKALDENMFLLALLSSLTLPDICGMAEYPAEASTKKRYIAWYDKEVGLYEKPQLADADEKVVYLSGEIIYNLRCSLLHEGNPNIDNSRLRASEPINIFSLVFQGRSKFDIYSDTSIVSTIGGPKTRSYSMNVRRICMILCNVAEAYYKENKSKFHFDFNIIDESQHKIPE